MSVPAEFRQRGAYYYRSDGSGPYSIDANGRPTLIKGPGFGITGNFTVEIGGSGYFKDDGSGPYAKDMYGMFYLITQ